MVEKWLFLAPNYADLEGHLPALAPWATTGAQTLDLGMACVNAKDGQSRVEPQALGGRYGQNRNVNCWLLLLACLLVVGEI